ncbi:MAG: nodulation protein NfeD, partial [Pseudomonadota bacterium]
IKAILASETPVATYVSPQGARSASAGLYIMYSAHVSAMAPSTNTGAATPVEVGGGAPPPEENPFEGEEPIKKDAQEDADGEDESAADESDSADATADTENAAAPRDDASDRVRETDPLSNDSALRAKIINDSVAYIRALAEERGRNADWAERAVREAVSVTSREALELNVIDLVADDLDDLLRQIDGREVETVAGPVTIKTENMQLERVEPTLVERILGFIANPNVAVILMSLATTGIIIEMWNPGSIFPGALGLVCLMLGLYSFQVLPFNWLPLSLMGIGVVLITIEAYTPTFGLAGLAGLALFAIGMYFLFPDGFRVSGSVIATTVAAAGAFLGLILFALIGSRSHGPLIGGEAIKRREGIVDDWDGKEGWIIVEGERWRARSDKPLSPGDKVRVVEVDGLILVVKQAKAGGLLGGLAPSEG